MMILLVLSTVVAVGLAVPPVWYAGGPCGRSKYPNAGDQPLPAGKFIVGGIQAQPWEFPWQTSMRTRTGSHFCGGFIINEQWVMTAAHCMVGETPGSISIVIGDHTRNDPSNTVRQTLDAAEIIVHPDYSARTLENDISLVRLASTITFNENIQPICAPEPYPADLHEYKKTVCSGWGTLSSGGVCCPQTLMYVSMNITTNAFCNAAYNGDVTADMICASDNNGGNDRDSCQGDSGGPLAIKNPDGSFTAAGIVSWGIGCASGYPGVYGRVAYHNTWILGHLGLL